MAGSEIVFRLLHGLLADTAVMHRAFRHPKKVQFTICSVGVSCWLVVLPACSDFIATALCLVAISVHNLNRSELPLTLIK